MLHVKLIQELEKKQSGSRISLIYGITVWQNYGDICLIKGELEKKSEIELKMEVFPYENMQIQEKKYTKWFDYDKIKEIPCVRKRHAGDFLTVTKVGGRKKLKDYLIDCKVPRQERDSLTVLADGSHILWVVGYRISEYYKERDKQISMGRLEPVTDRKITQQPVVAVWVNTSDSLKKLAYVTDIKRFVLDEYRKMLPSYIIM